MKETGDEHGAQLDKTMPFGPVSSQVVVVPARAEKPHVRVGPPPCGVELMVGAAGATVNNW